MSEGIETDWKAFVAIAGILCSPIIMAMAMVACIYQEWFVAIILAIWAMAFAVTGILTGQAAYSARERRKSHG